MISIKLSGSERRRGVVFLLSGPLCSTALMLLPCAIHPGLCPFLLPLGLWSMYIFFRNLVLLRRDNWLRDVFQVDLQQIEKISPAGFRYKAGWSDLQSVEPGLSYPSLFQLFSRQFPFGPEPIRLVFLGGTAISISKLYVPFFWKVCTAIAETGPPDNPLLIELQRFRAADLTSREDSKKHALARWLVISQLFPLGLFAMAQIFHWWLGAPWSHYVLYTASAVVLSPCLLGIVLIYFGLSRKPQEQGSSPEGGKY